MKTYLKTLAVILALSFAAGYASAEMPTLYDSYQRGLRDDQQRQEQNAVRNTMQRRMNQQYYNDRLQNEIREQQDDMNYYQQQEHMRNQGWGRPGLDGGVR
jgi:hypothetical protein